MKITKIFVCSIMTGIMFLFFDMLIAILTNQIYSPHTNLPIWKIPPNISAGIVFDLINGFILVYVYLMISRGIPGSGWRKGLNYGIIVGLFRVAMAAFSTVVMYDVPIILVITSLITGYIEIVVLCIMVAVICERS